MAQIESDNVTKNVSSCEVSESVKRGDYVLKKKKMQKEALRGNNSE